MKTVGVNRAPVRIRHLGWAEDSGRDIFEKENLNKMVKKKDFNEHLGIGSDPPIWSDRKWVLHTQPRSPQPALRTTKKREARVDECLKHSCHTPIRSTFLV